MTITDAQNSITITPPDVATGGFLAVADVIDNPDPHSLLGVEYESDACITGDLWYDFCTTADGFVGVKNFTDSPDLVTGTPFVIYSAVE
jgi:hypothetical protein